MDCGITQRVRIPFPNFFIFSKSRDLFCGRFVSYNLLPLRIRGVRILKVGIKNFLLFFPILSLSSFVGFTFALTADEIGMTLLALKEKPAGERIAFWAEQFIGTAYDEDPQGEYVSKAAIVADERVDCMYLTFRAVELALSHTPEEAIQIALEKRFHSRGILQDGKVINYEDRFQYGEDMIASGKWGREVTGEIGRTIRVKGTRGRDFCEILPPQEIEQGMKKLKSGDIFFFITHPEKRKVNECVGHIGIIKIEEKPAAKEIYLIHASGLKNRGGSVKIILLQDYISKMPFVGVKISRFD